MKRCYINGTGCISAQKTFESDSLEDPIIYEMENVLKVVKPDYKKYISPSAVRRMSSGVKNSIVASKMAMSESDFESPDAIITGTGLGCMQDSEKFLRSILDNEEEFLTPTSFIQSTHNTVGGQIALDLNCKSYNFTYVNSGVSFESALLDGLLQIQSRESENVLIGGIEEQADYTIELYKLIGHIKDEGEAPFTNIIENRTSGAITGEGAAFFTLQDKKEENTYSELKDLHFVNNLNTKEQHFFVKDFLDKNDLKFEDIDTIVMGNNGDSDFDFYYDGFEKNFTNVTSVVYKHLFGEFMTASSIGFWVANQLIKTQRIPVSIIKENNRKSDSIRNVLIYNQYRGKDHSLILLQNV